MTDPADEQATEDSRNDPETSAVAYSGHDYRDPETSHGQRAYNLAETVRAAPLTDDQATELAKVYAALEAAAGHERTTEALRALQQPLEAISARLEALEAFLGVMGLAGLTPTPQSHPEAPTATSSPSETEQQ